MQKWISLIVGSVAGGTARYLLSDIIHSVFGSEFPYGTLAVNLIGCFLVGIVSATAEDQSFLGFDAKVLLMIGFCGAFTTFSSFIVDTTHLIKTGHELRAFLNVTMSIMIGLIVFRIGVFVAEAF